MITLSNMTSVLVRRCLTKGFSLRPTVRLYSNAPKFDEAEMFGAQLSKPYKAKRLNRLDYDWTKEGEGLSQDEVDSRYIKMMKLNAVFKGMGLFLLIGGAATIYLSWPNIKSKYILLGKSNKLPSDIDETAFAKKVQSFVGTGDDSVNTYIWGSINKSTIPKALKANDLSKWRKLLLAHDNLTLGIDNSGNLVDLSSDQVLLTNQNLVDIKCSSNTVYALNKNGHLLIIPTEKLEHLDEYITMQRSWLMPWRRLPYYDYKLDTSKAFKRGERKIIDYDVGKEHVVVISNTGKAYTCSTATKENVGERVSYGQFGIPYFSKFDTFPKPNELHEIEMLNTSFDHSGKIISKTIVQVACGDYHTLARDSIGNLYSFGWNRYGQLGMPISYKSESIPYPRIINGAFNAHFPGANTLDIKCVNIKCSGETSYVAMKASPKAGHLVGESKNILDVNKEHYFSFGNGIYGELGNGTYKNSQQEPTKIKFENAKPAGAVAVTTWSTGSHHVICTLSDGSVVAWGNNEYGQLGNGKKVKVSKPIQLPEILPKGEKKSVTQLPESSLTLKSGQDIVTGETNSCIYRTK